MIKKKSIHIYFHFLSVKFFVAFGIGYFFSITRSNANLICYSKSNTISLHSVYANLSSYLY